MSLRIDRAELEIVIKNDTSRTKLRELEDKMKDIRKEMRKFKEGTPEWEALNTQLRNARQEYDNIYNSIGILNLSMRELRNRQRELNVILQNLPPTHPLYQQYRMQLDQVNARISELRGTADRTRLSLSNLANGFNKYLGLGAAFMATITGMSYTFRKMAEDVAKMDDKYSDVMKTTQMTRDEVVDLNNEFKKMDTRTAREELNNLARDAGKLGLQGKKDIMDFVDAGNQINVALGEELGDGAIKNIGKMTDTYIRSTKEMESMDLKGKMLATGSAINELGASSTASESYLVDFTQRLGGVASQAGISIQNILGYASALDQSGQAVEMSATALQNFIMKLMGDPAKFAKLAGLEVSKFNKLLKEDTNEAIKQVLTALSEKGGFQALIPLFKDMGLDGARAVGVLSALATNIDKVNVAQDISNKAFSDGTSITNEYNTKNNNLQATLEKQRKVFQDAALELGERLNPVLLQSTNFMTYFIRLLPGLIDWFGKYGITILYIVTIGTVYVAGLKLQTLWTTTLGNAIWRTNTFLKLKAGLLSIVRVAVLAYNVVINILTGNIVRAEAAQKLLMSTLKLNSFGIATVAVTALVAALGYLIYKVNNVMTATKAVKEATEQFNEELGKEQSQANKLFESLKRLNPKSEEYTKIKNKIIELYGPYLQGLIDEKGNLLDVAKAQEIVNTKIRENITLKIRNAATDKLQEDSIKNQVSSLDDVMKAVEMQLQTAPGYTKEASNAIRENINKAISESISNGKTGMEDLMQSITKIVEKEGVDLKKKTGLFQPTSLYMDIAALSSNVYNSQKEIKKVEDQFKGMISEAVELNSILEGSGGNGKTPPTPPSDPAGKGDKSSVQREKVNNALKKIEETHLTEMASIKKKYAEGEIKSESEHNKLILDQQNKFDNEQKNKIKELLADKSITETSIRLELSKQLADIEQKNYDRLIAQNEKLKKIILDADPKTAEKQSHEERLRELGLFGVARENMTADQLEVLRLLEEQHAEKIRKLDSKDASLKLKKLATEQAQEESELADKRNKGLISEEKYKDDLLLIEIKYLNEKLKINGLSADKIEEINKQIVEKQRSATEDKTQKRQSFLDRFNLESPKSKYEKELELLRYYEEQGIITHEEATKAKKQIDTDYYYSLTEKTRQALSGASQIAGTLASALSDQQQSEESAIDRRYKAEIDAAGKNSKKVARLEAEKEAAIHAVRAKYADKQFILTVAQVVSSTAVAAMEAYRAMAGIPVVGPALGALAAGAALLAGKAQISAAKEQQQAAKKGYKTGGYTGSGNSDNEEAGVVHKNEFVANADAVRNPQVKKFLDVFDVAQKKGTIRMLNTTQILDRVKSGGYKNGGYTSAPPTDNGSSAVVDAAMGVIAQNTEVMQRLSNQIDGGIVAINQISGKRGLSKKLKDYEDLTKPVSR